MTHHLVIQDGADDMRDEVRREPVPRPTRKEIDRILAVIEHRLAWLELNHTPDDLPAMVRDLAAYVARRRK